MARALASGNAARGAILFHGPLLGCAKCHTVSSAIGDLLGPNLALDRPDETPEQLVQSILQPAAKVDEKYQAVNVLTEDGQVISGVLMPHDENKPSDHLVLRDLTSLLDKRIPKDEIVQQKVSEQSVMPAGIVRALANEAEFCDLLRYLVEIRDGGEQRARELQPTSAQLAIQLPEYEAELDHAGMIGEWDQASLERGREIYMGLCVNCHGTLTTQGSLATALRFGEGKFKHGSDPYSIYQTLTRGAGLMLPQPWMVPQQKYDVIHYLREEFLKSRNSAAYHQITDEYLAELPKGNQRGPAPIKIEPWSQADYGPRLVNTYEIGSGGRNIAQKGIAIQLDQSPGGIAHGKAWVVFDHDTFRVAGVWTSRGFIDWQGIHFNGRHGIHPHVVGDILLANPTGPGWARPTDGYLGDEQRVAGRDGKRYGPLPSSWASYEGLYQVGRQSVLAYRVGETHIQESFAMRLSAELGGTAPANIFRRQLAIGPRDNPLEMVVATLDDNEGEWQIEGAVASNEPPASTANATDASHFRGETFYEVEDVGTFNMFDQDFSISAEIQATGNGTIFARAPRQGDWAPGGQTLFLRNGRLCYDVGWVGVIQSSVKVNDGEPHRVGLTWRAKTGLASLYVDGKRVGKKRLQPEELLEDAVFRIGRTSDNFPAPTLLDDSVLAKVELFQRELLEQDFADEQGPQRALASWNFKRVKQFDVIEDRLGGKAAISAQSIDSEPSRLIAGWLGSPGVDARLRVEGRQLLLNIPAGEPAQLIVWSTRVTSDEQSSEVAERIQTWRVGNTPDQLQTTQPTEPIFPETIVTQVELGGEQGGFAVDTLRVPTVNPWSARVRTTGHDFFDDGDRMAVCTWDGDVWIVSGMSGLDAKTASPKLTWRRIAFGLFQPLGLKIIDGQIYLTCRDQLVRLEDRNGDGEIDFYHCINNDHQVTEHFHEFAMGLQTDEAGDFYYAKSARHALPALVPHHGTLLKVSKDGSQTTILANGFRAANGVCLNPDGTFIVTDQEGHWNPKNRINWVEEGGFYGNMYGYHDVTDESDEAMSQPLCWITNKFDRSPAELLWVDSPAWGPFQGKLLNLSYGYGKVYVVPHETVSGQVQGGMCQLPIDDFPTGTIRGRFSPFDGQLYLSGLSAWATSQTMEEGGMYRIRYTGKPAALPVGLAATADGLTIDFSEPLGANTSLNPKDYGVQVWSLKRTKNYGSDHYDQHALNVSSVSLSDDRRQLHLQLPGIAPTWCMEIRLPVVTADGKKVERVIHNTIHNLGQ